MAQKRFYIYCDESVKNGKFFSDFYGGLLISADDASTVIAHLDAINATFGRGDEIKWTKTDMLRLDLYTKMVDALFDLIEQDKVKIRIMFRQNRHRPTGLTDYHRTHHFFLLYYQFLKAAFGLKHTGKIIPADYVDLEFFFDKLPDKNENNALFKKYIFGLQYLPTFLESNIHIREDAIMEIDSRKHILLQCLDIVLGAIAFRLNKMHLEKEPGKSTRGKRTIAKERLYKHILVRIRQIYPNFNIGISTGLQDDVQNLWKHAYRHWRFLPRNWEVQE